MAYCHAHAKALVWVAAALCIATQATATAAHADARDEAEMAAFLEQRRLHFALVHSVRSASDAESESESTASQSRINEESDNEIDAESLSLVTDSQVTSSSSGHIVSSGDASIASATVAGQTGRSGESRTSTSPSSRQTESPVFVKTTPVASKETASDVTSEATPNSPPASTTCPGAQSCMLAVQISSETQAAYNAVFDALQIAANTNIRQVVRESESPLQVGDERCAGTLDVLSPTTLRTTLRQGNELVVLTVASTSAIDLELQRATYTTAELPAFGRLQLLIVYGANKEPIGPPTLRFQPPLAAEFVEYPPVVRVSSVLVISSASQVWQNELSWSELLH